MKKLFSLVLALVLLLPVIAYANVLTEDWRTASDDELATAVELISAEIRERKNIPEKAEGINPDSDCQVTAIGVGYATKGLSYEVTETGLRYWQTKSGPVKRFAYIAVKNTDSKAIYLSGCTMDFEDRSGKLLESCRSNSCPDVIEPGETGYYYVSSMNGGSFNDATDLSNGCNMTAQFSLALAREIVQPFELTDLELSVYKYFNSDCPLIKGRISNNSNEDIKSSYINYLFRDLEGKVIWISGTNITGLHAGVRIGLELKEIFGPPYLTMDQIGSYEVIAKPYYFQYN